VDLALGIVLLLILVRIVTGLFLPESQDLFSWKVGFGWLGLPWEGPQPSFTPDSNGPDFFAAYHWEIYGVSIRPSFIFEHANTFGCIAAFGLVYGITRGGRLGLFFLVVFGLLLVSSTSNTSIVAAAAGIGLFLLVKLLKQASTKWLRGLMIVGLVLASAVVLWRVSFDSFNFMGRRSLWEPALQTIDLQALTGVGGQVWQADVVEGSSVGDELHNSFLSALAWGGLPGLMLLIALWALALTAAVQAVRRGNLASACLLTTCLVISMTESTFAYRYWSMGNALLLAAVLLSQWQPPSRSKDLPIAPGAQTAGLQGAPARRPR
jgi:O-antigen ligase